MQKAHYENRREKVRALLRKKGLSALIVSLDANRYYLSGFELHDPQPDESSGRLVIMADGNDWLCTDARFTTAAERLWDPERIMIYQGDAMGKINSLIRDKSSGTVGFEASILSVDAYERVSNGLAMERADGLIESLRMIKDPEEILRIERSCALNHKLMEWVPQVLTPGRSESAIAWDIEQFFRNNGAEELSFASIVAIGPNAALPHAVPGEDCISENCSVLVDVGCRLGQYCSDQTRTFWVGDREDTWFSEGLKYVQEAQRRAIQAIRPGVTGAAVYAVAKDYLDSKGVGDLFTHGLGHGVGLQTHEGPRLGSLASLELRPHMVVTVEPGIYYPGLGGIRWEHMVLVTEDGFRVL